MVETIGSRFGIVEGLGGSKFGFSERTYFDSVDSIEVWFCMMKKI